MPKRKLYDRVSKDAFERLELSAGKLARSVLRGLGAGNRVRLPYNSTTRAKTGTNSS